MRNINFCSSIELNEALWLVTKNGFLMKYDYKNNIAKYVIDKNNTVIKFERVYDKIIAYDDKLYFMEVDASIFYEYDIKTNEYYCYSMPEMEMINWRCFSGIYLYENKIFLFGKRVGKICYFDINKKDFTCIFSSDNRVTNYSVEIDNKIYLASGEKIISYNMDSLCFEQTYILEDEIMWINNYNNSIFSILKNGNILEFNITTSETKNIYIDPNSAMSFSRCFITKNKIFVFPFAAEHIGIIDRSTGKLSYVDEPDDINYYKSDWSKYGEYSECLSHIWIANRISNYAVLIEKNTEKLLWLQMRAEDLRNIFAYIKNDVFDEETYTLSEFLYAIS